MKAPRYELDDLLRVMARLRDPATGCPWDIRQDFRSIVPSTLEECYELAQAIEHEDFPHVAEALGDVLFQVVFYAQLGSERDLFSFETIVDTLVTKLLRRHPHVFADGEIEGVVPDRTSVESVKETWESIKQAERSAKSQGATLADVPLALPALPRAQKLQKRAARVNFDWPDAAGVLAKLEEEIAELRRAMAAGPPPQPRPAGGFTWRLDWASILTATTLPGPRMRSQAASMAARPAATSGSSVSNDFCQWLYTPNSVLSANASRSVRLRW